MTGRNCKHKQIGRRVDSFRCPSKTVHQLLNTGQIELKVLATAYTCTFERVTYSEKAKETK